MFRNAHNHEYRLPSPVRQSVSKYVHVGLKESQIRSSLLLDHLSLPVTPIKLSALIQAERRKNRPEIFSVFDFRKGCDDYQDGTVLYEKEKDVPRKLTIAALVKWYYLLIKYQSFLFILKGFY
jgi:hypothetical protein